MQGDRHLLVEVTADVARDGPRMMDVFCAAYDVFRDSDGSDDVHEHPRTVAGAAAPLLPPTSTNISANVTLDSLLFSMLRSQMRHLLAYHHLCELGALGPRSEAEPQQVVSHDSGSKEYSARVVLPGLGSGLGFSVPCIVLTLRVLHPSSLLDEAAALEAVRTFALETQSDCGDEMGLGHSTVLPLDAFAAWLRRRSLSLGQVLTSTMTLKERTLKESKKEAQGSALLPTLGAVLPGTGDAARAFQALLQKVIA